MGVAKTTSKAKPIKKPTQAKTTKKTARVVSGSAVGLLPYKKFSSRRALLLAVLVAAVGIGTIVYTFAAITTVSTKLQAENMSWSKGVTAQVGDNNTIGKALYWNTVGTGTIQTTVDSDKLTFNARGDQCNGSPVMSVALDGKVIAKQTIGAKKLTSYSVTLDPKIVKKGKHVVSFTFANDLYKPKVCDRNVYIDDVILSGPKPIEIIPPKPTATEATVTNPKPTTPRTQVPAPAKPQTYNSQAPYTIIMIGWRPYEKDYAQLGNSKVNLTYRTKERTSQAAKPKLDLWDSTGHKYFILSAASDWASFESGGGCKNIPLLYIDKSQGDEMVKRPGSLGFFMHEVSAQYAACNGWNWSQATTSMDWVKINDYIMTAKAQNKKVIWSEPAQGWEAIAKNPTYQAMSPQWKGVLVPMFATNFKTASFDHVPAARSGAVSAATKLQSPVGESVQSWYFRESTVPLNVNSTVTLANLGREVGATYYQIEGTYDDMAWGTDYMNGILAFSRALGQ